MAYAEPDDLVAQWRTLTSQEATRATALLDMAAILIDSRVDLTGLPDEHPRVRAARQVSIEMVREALSSATRGGGVSSHSVQLDGAAESRTYRDGDYAATVNLTFDMLALLGLSASAQSPVGYFGDCP
ncbi:hypothetical protein [Gordonia sp. UCD-TK1]|uniref:hypothetical protein n=1 Tax=Gordonia sp. UCD-TK1 TaxID=1857893 RepID=UPI00080DC2BF|nr:hypothetical protein [Gordonia sp. UCD-TK1]OCH80204.1 hypothetical protein A9310_22540 [Gordonia sp. UCD-TK1]